jgi:hypothetical protein
MHRYLRVFALAAAALLALPPAPVAADGTASGWTDGAGVGARAESDQDLPAGSPRRSGPKPRCTYDEMTPKEAENTDHMAKNGLGPERGEGPGRWLWKTCVEPDGNAWGTVAWIPQRTNPETVARRALQYTALPGPAIGMSPPPGRGAVVNLPQWLWVDSGTWAPTNATATIDGVTVTTAAQPERVVFDMGNGDQVVCDGPGTPYDPRRPEAEQRSDCTYTYRTSSAGQPGGTFVVTATVEWRITWTALGAAGGGDLGVVRRSASQPLPVAEIQSLNRPPR